MTDDINNPKGGSDWQPVRHGPEGGWEWRPVRAPRHHFGATETDVKVYSHGVGGGMLPSEMAKKTSYIEHLFEEIEGLRDVRWRYLNANDVLSFLRAMQDMNEFGHIMERRAVLEAREAGFSWAQIAEAMKRSRQSVHRQYAREDDELGVPAEDSGEID